MSAATQQMQLALHSRDDFRHTARSPDADQRAENLVILIGMNVTENKTRKLTRVETFLRAGLLTNIYWFTFHILPPTL